jgi:predicted aspartyl protease
VITGTVKPSREAVVDLKLRGINGLEVTVEAILDTGLTESITLPQALVAMLALPYVNLERVTLADGSIVDVELYRGLVNWEGQDRRVIVHCMEGTPLIGMSLIWDTLVTMKLVNGGSVTIDSVP